MKKLKNIVIALFWTSSVIAVFVLYGFVNSEFENTVVHRLEIEIANDNRFHFLDEDEVKNHLRKTGTEVIGLSMAEIQPIQIREKVMEMSAVKKADVFKNIDGSLRIRVEQRTPLCRILNADGSGFYLDEDGRVMPLSHRYSAHVLIFTGNLHENAELGSITYLESQPDLMKTSMLDECFKMALFIEQDKLLQNLTEHVVVTSDREFDIVPRFGDCRIKFGTPHRPEAKTKKLALFYKETLGKVNLGQYKTIDLRFRRQVVCGRINS